MKIVFLDAATMGDASLEPLAKLGDFEVYTQTEPEDVSQRVRDCDVLIVNKVRVTEEVFNAARNLKLVCVAATGVNNIDLKAAEKRGIPVRNVAGYSTDSVSQITWMHILSLFGNAQHYDSVVKSGRYSESLIFTDVTQPYTEIAGKRIGIIGMGAIGSKVAKIARAFDMDVCYFSTSGTSHCTEYPSLSLEELLKTSDVVSIHAPYNERTAGLIGLNELKMMKKEAFIVNMGRGGIIVEEDLAKAIDDEIIAGAAIDVFVKEPLPADSPLLHTRHPERLRFTPHTGWASREARNRLTEGMAENIKKGW